MTQDNSKLSREGLGWISQALLSFRVCYTRFGILDPIPVRIRKSKSAISVSTLFRYYLRGFCASIDHSKVIRNPNTQEQIGFLMPMLVPGSCGWMVVSKTVRNFLSFEISKTVENCRNPNEGDLGNTISNGASEPEFWISISFSQNSIFTNRYVDFWCLRKYQWLTKIELERFWSKKSKMWLTGAIGNVLNSRNLGGFFLKVVGYWDLVR